MGLMATLERWFGDPTPARDAIPLSFDDWLSYFQFGQNNYGSLGLQQTLLGSNEEIPGNFTGLVEQAYKSNGVVFACMLVRQLLFSEARFQFRQMRNGRPGDLFGTQALSVLEKPWPGGTTGDLLTRAIQDADLAGNFFCVRRADRIRRLRPDWVTIVLGSRTDSSVVAGDIDAEVMGYLYHPGGRGSGKTPVTLGANEVAHFAPIPDPVSSYRGMSWLTPVIREIAGDSAATQHKIRYFENGATPNLVVSLDADIELQVFREWIELFKQDHEGVANAYKTLFLGAGAKAEAVGSNLAQIDFKVVQGAGETRIAAAAGVPPVIVGLSEGLAAATYSNYGQARRRLTDGTMRPLWRNFAGSMAAVIDIPVGAELWYDDRDIPFLQEDVKDAADIQSVQAQAIKALVDAGFDAQSCVTAVVSGDLSLLTHSGLFSVQLQPPNPNQPETPAARAVRAVEELIAERIGASQ